MEYLKRINVPMPDALKIIEDHFRKVGKIPTTAEATYIRMEKHGNIVITFVENKDKRIYVLDDPSRGIGLGKLVEAPR